MTIRRTGPAHALAWATLTASGLYVFTCEPGTSWPKAAVAGCVILAAAVLLRDELEPEPDVDDAFGRLVHPSAWGCTADDWPAESDGIPGRNDR